ncbi:hypothetical protein [Paraburkholderia sp. BL10I2N1]|uniref:hypothetical protein n=1 Tax=Paraburkholderia sp. BL10I2N1 TaxID=1938796 RepID=UPI0010602FE1|nr:hypothetical protein [Paraburkholderia sp. BL10I2N1]TDN69124.1 hypothetical protein B0G77_2495 [Paraburkholderia sp. BL10I2N1]
MKAILVFLATVCVSCFAYASEPIASVESPDLGPVPQAFRSTIEADISFSPYGSLNCKMQGKQIPLSSNSLASTWFVTTSEACGWGAALGPIWLVEKPSTGEPSLILATGGNSVAIAGKSHDGFVGIAIVSGTAEESVRKRYFFNGRKYVPSTK